MFHRLLYPGVSCPRTILLSPVLLLSIAFSLLLALQSAFFIKAAVAQSSIPITVTTQHNDNGRDGANLSETVLNTANVNSTQFGKLFSRTVSGYVYAQPLYVAALTVNGATHNVVYVVTMNNDVYAFDADDPNQTAPLWHQNLGPARTANLKTADFPGQQAGILSTPVIDPTTNTLYVVSDTSVNNSTYQIHALDLATGTEKFGGPTLINPTVPGTGANSTNGIVAMNATLQLQRPGLLLSNGKVYVAFGSTGDYDPYHGWIVGYTAADLTQPPLVFCSTPNGTEGGIWQGANGLTADAAGNIYAATGNGTFDVDTAPTPGQNLGNTLVKLNPSLSLLDWFTPQESTADNANDLDLGSSGFMVIPGSPYLIGGGKTSILYLVDPSNMGHYNSTADAVLQKVPLNAYHLHGGPIYWNSPTHGPTIYTWAEQDYLKAFGFNGTQLTPTPAGVSVIRAPTIANNVYGAMPGGILSLSANGSTSGTGIVWANIPSTTGFGRLPGVLRAFDADNLGHELWDSLQNASRDDFGFFGKFAAPTVANGKVYVSTSSGTLAVYGLLSNGPSSASGSLAGSVSTTVAAVNLTAEGTSDWVHWGLTSVASYDHKAAGNSQISDKTVLGNVAARTYGNNPSSYTWTDGTPTAAATNSATGVFVTGVGDGFQITAPADTNVRTLRVYVGAYHGQGQLTATLSDGSAPTFTDTSLDTTSTGVKVYTLTYQSGSAGQHVTVAWTLKTDHGNGNVTLQAASLTSTAPPPASTGSLAGSVSATVAAINLTAEGTSDWVHWGLTSVASYDHKATVVSQISDKSVLGNVAARTYGNNPSSYTWTDGTPTAAATNSATGVFVTGVGDGFQITAPADTNVRTLRVYVGAYHGQGQLTATLSDGSAPTFMDSSLTAGLGSPTGVPDVYTLTYKAASAGQHLTVVWTLLNDLGTGNVTLQAATLVATPPPPVGALSGASAQTVAAVNLTAEGTSDWVHWGLTSVASYDHKATVVSQISDKSVLGTGTVKTYANNPSSYTWNDGTPTAAATNSATGVYIAGVGNGFQITAPADTNSRTLKVYVGAYHGQGQLTATLSDGSAAVFTDTSLTAGTGSGGLDKVYTLTYNAVSAGQHLTVAWTLKTDLGTGNVTLQAATLVSATGSPSH